jgi:hypothetical protein
VFYIKYVSDSRIATLARQFGVAWSTISEIKKGRNWSWIWGKRVVFLNKVGRWGRRPQ